MRNDNRLMIKRFVVGPLGTNCYIIADTATKEACLIDPGFEAKVIKSYIAREGLHLKFIINTHGHGDHIAANRDFDVPIFIHKLEADFLTDTSKNLSRMFMAGVVSPKAGKLLEDGDTLKLGNLEMRILHTPGHTPGSISIVVDKIAFTGDALFAGSIGRTDFAYGDQDQLMNSITQKLFMLNDDTVIYPGHGEPSTIGEEKISNPFFR